MDAADSTSCGSSSSSSSDDEKSEYDACKILGISRACPQEKDIDIDLCSVLGGRGGATCDSNTFLPELSENLSGAATADALQVVPVPYRSFGFTGYVDGKRVRRKNPDGVALTREHCLDKARITKLESNGAVKLNIRK